MSASSLHYSGLCGTSFSRNVHSIPRQRAPRLSYSRAERSLTSEERFSPECSKYTRSSFFSSATKSLRSWKNKANRVKSSSSLLVTCNFEEPLSIEEDPNEWGGLTNQILHLTHTTELLSELISLLHELDEPLDGGAVVAELIPGMEDEHSSTVELSVEIFSNEELEPEPRGMIRQSIIEFMPDACSCVLIVQRLCVENITFLSADKFPAVFLSGKVQRNAVGRILQTQEHTLQPRPVRRPQPQTSEMEEREETNNMTSSHPEVDDMTILRPCIQPAVNRHKLEQCLAQNTEAFGVAIVTPEGGRCFFLARRRTRTPEDEKLSSDGMKKQSLDVCYAICDQRLRAQLELLA